MVVLLVATLAVLAGGAVALAAEGETDIAGRGWLACRGRGVAELDMGGTLRLQINGDVTIEDVAGDARVFINDREDDDTARTTDIVLTDFEGGIKVTGSHFVVVAKGTMRFGAVGHGFAHLDGKGVCKYGPYRAWFRWTSRVEI
jgi:hypothetical protein